MSVHQLPARGPRSCPVWCVVPGHTWGRLWAEGEPVEWHESAPRRLPGGLAVAVVAEGDGPPAVALYSDAGSSLLDAGGCRAVAAALVAAAGDLDGLGCP